MLMKGGIMLIRILIVDDEPKVRRGLVNKLNWEDIGCTIIGEADNGIEAKRIIDAQKPDIVITDIKMPGMDGLELSHYVNENYPFIKVILLTGYDEFSFAQSAINSNAFSYLVKPTLPQEIVNVVNNAIGEIQQARREKEDVRNLREMLQQVIPVMKNQVLGDMLFGNYVNIDQLLDRAKLCGIEMNVYCVIIVEAFRYFSNEKMSFEKEMLDRFEIRKRLREVVENPDVEVFESLNGEKIVFLLYSKNPAALNGEEIYNKARLLHDEMKSSSDIDTFIAVSSLNQSSRDVHRAYYQCLNAISFRDIFTSDSIINAGDILSIADDTYLLAKKYANRLNENINACNRDNVKMILRDMFDIFTRGYNVNLNNVKEIIWTIMYNAERDVFFSGGGSETKLLTADNKQKIIGAQSLNDVFCNITAILGNLMDEITQSKKLKYNSIIQRACHFIEKNHEKNISLDDVSNHTGISSGYLSRMFKDQMEMNFIEYVAMVRINKAKQLLEHSAIKVKEVGDRVGIGNPAYFGSLFKKYTGKTPTEYKEFVSGNKPG